MSSALLRLFDEPDASDLEDARETRASKEARELDGQEVFRRSPRPLPNRNPPPCKLKIKVNRWKVCVCVHFYVPICNRSFFLARWTVMTICLLMITLNLSMLPICDM